jgi:phytoene dehydrogenase-like protein
MFEEFPDETSWDVVIIGGGPNGLMAGAYLAKAGLKVAVVERRFEVGGGLATEEIIYPLYSSNPHVVYHMMVDYMPVIKDFNLDDHALVWVKPNSQTAMVFEDGKSLVLTRMIEDTKDSISKFSFKDAIAFGKVMRTWRRIVNEIVAPATYIPPMSPIDLSVAMMRTPIGSEMLEMVDRSPLEIINEVFENDRVRAMMLYSSCMWGLDPRETGIGFFVPLLLDRGMNKYLCYGGSHKFAAAMAREIVRNGGMILEAAEATKILMNNGHVEGVLIGNEERTLKAKVVMSTLDPQTTFFDLVGKDKLPASLKDAVEGWKYDKWSFYTLHVASEEAPHYASDDPWVNEAFMTVFGFESTEQLLAHWDNVVEGNIGSNFGGHSTCESLFDPHLSRKPGKHVSFFQMHAPYEIEGGWEKIGRAHV